MNLLSQLASRIMAWLILIGVLLVLTAVTSILVFYVMFRRSDAGRWRHNVLSRLAAALQRQTRLRTDLRTAAREEDIAVASCRERALQNYLRTIPLSELDPYPGIGPVTIERLRAAGFRSVDD